MSTARITVDQLVPGGIRPTDYLHVRTNDDTCSRCRAPLGGGEVPLMIWVNDGQDLYLFCESCTDPEGRSS